MPQNNLFPPTQIPDLSALNPQSEWATLLRVFVGNGPSDHIAHTLWVNSVRLLDAAICEYSLGRAASLAFHARKPEHFGIGYITQASTHFESCIWHLERFIKHTRALRSLKFAEIELKALIPSNLSFLSQSAESQITQLRHTLAHLEGAALRRELPQGASIALLPLESGLSISGHAITWGNLVQWLRDAHACIEQVIRFQPASVQVGA